MKKDVVVIGAGPAGLSFACSLASSGLQILVVERSSTESLANPAVDGRDIALTHLSRKILNELEVWGCLPDAEVFPIRKACVVDGKSPYRLQFDRGIGEQEDLGYLVSNHLIRKALFEQVRQCQNVQLLTDTSATSVDTGTDAATVNLSTGEAVKTSLVVAADSRFSETRRKAGIPASMHDFGRVAIVCRMKHRASNQATAWECFHYGQTLAVLPLSGNESSIVITVPSDRADHFMTQPASAFNERVEAQLDGRLGAMELSSDRFAYPLVAVWAKRFAGHRFALIGDAAVGMHPVTAHGFNLGLRGQHTLAGLVSAAASAGTDIGSDSLLRRYESKHQRAARPIYLGTNAIVKLFTNDLPVHRLARKMVLRFGNVFPPIRRAITRQLTEISG
jgi:ubiquinone biosynthesis UbiH/UbiF/VisC/COQ6 family hydroxylase